jgi:hypothetical protein
LTIVANTCLYQLSDSRNFTKSIPHHRGMRVIKAFIFFT